MMPADAQSAVATVLLNPLSCAATANATGTGVAVKEYVGQLVVVVQVGAVTGTITPTLQHCDDTGGTNAADLTPIEGDWGSVTANKTVKRTFTMPAKPYVRIKGTIVTGPALFSAVLIARPKASS